MAETRTVDAVVLGGADNLALRECSDEPYEAFIELGGRPVVEYVVQALVDSSSVGRVAFVGPGGLPNGEVPHGVDLVAERGETIFDSIRRGTQLFEGEEMVLIATSDIPFLTPEAVDDFVSKGLDTGVDVCYALVPREAIVREYPTAKRTYFRLADEQFTGGNILLVSPRVLSRIEERGEEVLRARKNPLRMCSLLGPVCLAKFLLGRLSVRDVEQTVERLLGVKGAAVVSEYPGVGLDLDKPDDYRLMVELLDG